MKNLTLTDKHIMVTGGSAGLGLAIATECTRLGAAVTALDIRESDHAHSYLLDVTDVDAWKTLAQTHAAPDVLFLNAGVMSAPNGADAQEYRFFSASPESYQKIRSVNLDGVVFGLQTLAPKMNSGGCIIITASMAGLHPYAFDPIYAATKHALVGLVRSAGKEFLDRGLRIQCYCPNRILTDLLPQATRAQGDLTTLAAARGAVQLIDESSSGYAWVLESEESGLRRYPPVARTKYEKAKQFVTDKLKR